MANKPTKKDLEVWKKEILANMTEICDAQNAHVQKSVEEVAIIAKAYKEAISQQYEDMLNAETNRILGGALYMRFVEKLKEEGYIEDSTIIIPR